MLNTSSQVRKFNVGVTGAVQAVSQIIHRFNSRDAAESFISTMKTRVAFGDTFAENSEDLSKLFGETNVFSEETTNSGETLVDTFNSNRQAQRIKSEVVRNITASDLGSLERGTIAVCHPVEDGAELFVKIKRDLEKFPYELT